MIMTIIPAALARDADHPQGQEGEPCLIRTMNAGLATHSVHIHGNHCMECSETDEYGANVRETHVYERDTWMLEPLGRIDMILPFTGRPTFQTASGRRVRKNSR